MFETILSWPIAVVIPVLWCIAMLRGNATYWIARVGNTGYRKLRTERRPLPAYERARVLIERYGPIAVVFCFLTIGLQTAVLAISGITRMPLRRFLPAVAAGSVLWAVAYGTIGLAVVQAWVLAVAGSWWSLVALGVAALVVGLLWWQHRAGRTSSPDAERAAADVPDGEPTTAGPELSRRSEHRPSSTAP